MWFIFMELHWLLLLTAISTVVYYYVIRPWNYFKRHGIAFDRGVPPFGSYYNKWFKGESWLETQKRIYYEHPNARFVGMYEVGGAPSYLIRDPELIKDITTKNFGHFMDRIIEYHGDTDPVYANGLSNLKAEPWKKKRSVLTPLYTSNKFRTVMIPAMIESKRSLVERLIAQVGDGDGKEVDMMDICTRSSIDAYGRCALGIETDVLDNAKNEFKEAADDIVSHMNALSSIMEYSIVKFPRLSKLLFGATALSQSGARFFQRVVKEVATARTNAGVERLDLLGLVVNARQQSNLTENNNAKAYSDAENDMIAQCYEFFEASFTETNVIIIINYIAQTLTAHTDIQRRLRDEMLQINRSLDNGALTTEALREMKYMDAVLSESLRMCPITTELKRRAVKPYTLTDHNRNSIVVQPGEAVWMPSYTLQNDSQYFPNPQKFDPERFSEENKGNIQKGTYAPFGMGPRDCIGCRFTILEVKATFFYLLQQFELTKNGDIENDNDGNVIVLKRRANCLI